MKVPIYCGGHTNEGWATKDNASAAPAEPGCFHRMIHKKKLLPPKTIPNVEYRTKVGPPPPNSVLKSYLILQLQQSVDEKIPLPPYVCMAHNLCVVNTTNKCRLRPPGGESRASTCPAAGLLAIGAFEARTPAGKITTNASDTP